MPQLPEPPQSEASPDAMYESRVPTLLLPSEFNHSYMAPFQPSPYVSVIVSVSRSPSHAGVGAGTGGSVAAAQAQPVQSQPYWDSSISHVLPCATQSEDDGVRSNARKRVRARTLAQR